MIETQSIKIGELAKKASVTTRTIRYYEELDLLQPEKYSSKGNRIYSEKTIDKLIFIKNLKELNFSLHEIQKIVNNINSCNTGAELSKCLTSIIKKQITKNAEKINNYEKVQNELKSYYSLSIPQKES